MRLYHHSETDFRVSIIVLVYNALEHVQALMETRVLTEGVEAEWIVVDNASDAPTREYLKTIPDIKLIRSETNRRYAGGNNFGVQHASEQKLLLLNSDVRIIQPNWLSKLMAIHKHGISSYGVVNDPPRCDGFCTLIDRDVYGEGLNENFPWWWSLTQMQANCLKAGFSIQSVRKFREIVHAGQGSGPIPRELKGMDTPRAVVRSWFEGLPSATIFDSLPD